MNIKTLFFSILAMSLLVGCREKETSKTTFDPTLPVEVMVVHSSDENSKRNYVGSVKSEMQMPVSFTLGGTLTGIYVKNGQQVKRGQLIAKVDETTARSLHEAAKATLNQAEDGYRRLKQLHDEGGIPEVRWVQMETDLEKARQTEISSRKQLMECTLRASQDGFISIGEHTIGEIMRPSEPLCHIIDMDKMAVEFSVPEKEIGFINIGDKAVGTFPALDDLKKNLEIYDKAIVSNPFGHTYTIRARVPVDGNDILPGMVVKIELALAHTSGIIIPASCVITMPTDADVWVANNGKAFRRRVRISDFVKNGVVVTEGLNDGDTIVIQGYHKLYNGAKISF